MDLSCKNEPDMDKDEWSDWESHHFDMPYVYWLPACQDVTEWVNKNYRFSMEP